MVKGFTKKKISPHTLGEQLKAIRGEHRVGLSDVSRETKIPLKYLSAIEEGEHEKLPPVVYVRGFLKSYADFLGISPEKLVAVYERERQIKVQISGGSDGQPAAPKLNVPKLVVTPKIFATIFSLLFVVGGFYYIYKEINRFAAEPRLVVTSPSENEIVEGNAITVTGFTDSDSRLFINDQPVLVGDNGEFKEDIVLQEGVNLIAVKAVNRFEKSSSQEVNIQSNYSTEMASSGEQSPEEGRGVVSGQENEKRQNVEIAVRIENHPTWLSIETDGSVVYSGTMLAGAEQEFKGENEIRITSGKANQTFIRVNGKEERLLADSPGIVRDILFTQND